MNNVRRGRKPRKGLVLAYRFSCPAEFGHGGSRGYDFVALGYRVARARQTVS
jgi:hypothetical protein